MKIVRASVRFKEHPELILLDPMDTGAKGEPSRIINSHAPISAAPLVVRTAGSTGHCFLVEDYGDEELDTYAGLRLLFPGGEDKLFHAVRFDVWLSLALTGYWNACDHMLDYNGSTRMVA